MMLKKTAVAFALSIGFIAAANATNVDVDPTPTATGYDYVVTNTTLGSGGLFGVGDTFADTSYNTVGSFLDTWSFGLNSSAQGKGSVTTYEISGLTNFIVTLYMGTVNNPLSDGKELKTTFDADAKVYVAKGEGLYPTAGSYFYTVSGIASSGAENSYYLSTKLTAPVPEPETYAMLLTGLGLMATIARRRNKAKAS